MDGQATKGLRAANLILALCTVPWVYIVVGSSLNTSPPDYSTLLTGAGLAALLIFRAGVAWKGPVWLVLALDAIGLAVIAAFTWLW
jgi:hypothetical protein